MENSNKDESEMTGLGFFQYIRTLALIWIPRKSWRFLRIQKTVPETCVPLLYQEPGIKSEYRLEHKPWWYYFLSVFQIHNESGNIWTHLIASVILVFLTMGYSYEIDRENPFRAVILGFGVCCFICTALSTFAHTFHSKSHFLHYICYSIDYAGIGCFTLGTSIMFFYCSSQYDKFPLIGKYYLPLNIAMSWNGFFCSCMAKLRYRRPYPVQRRLWNLCSFGLQVIFILHFFVLRCIACGKDENCTIPSLFHHLMAWSLMSISVFFFSSHLPETKFPGRFDLMGNGHQIFHVLCVLQNIEQFRAAVIDIQTFSTITERIPTSSDLLMALVSYIVITVITLILLVPNIKKRVLQDEIFELQFEGRNSKYREKNAKKLDMKTKL